MSWVTSGRVRAVGAWLVIVVVLGCKARNEGDPLARVESMKPKLAKVRGLAFKSEVSASYQTAADFRVYMRRAVEKDAQSLQARSEALVALGLLPPSSDLGVAIENAYSTQAAAYYDFELKRFFFVMVPENKDVLDTISAHELTHALQDQHFGLTQYLRAADNSDAQVARQFVVEGDAMLAAIAYMVYAKTGRAELTPDQISAMRPKLEQIAMADPQIMATVLRQQASASSVMDPGIKAALDSMGAIPRTVLVPLMDAYMKGALLVLEAYERGGWRRVDELYRDPPESTEQVLHPKERLLSSIDRPRRVILPTFDGYTLVASDVLGELQWSVYFSLWNEGSRRVQENWDGDRFAVVRGKDGKLVSLIATIWDGDYDALLFYNAYVSTAVTRHGGETRTKGDQTLVDHGDSATWVLRIKERVYIVDGGLDGDLLGALVDGTTFE